MYRRAWVLLVGIAATMGVLALVVSYLYERPLLDPEGSFLGPTVVRLPLLLLGAVLLDLVPRTLWVSRGRPRSIMPIVRERLRTHWDRDRLTLVALGVVCFYVTYVSYRNLEVGPLPEVVDTKYDRELHLVDRVLMFGGDPSDVLHAALGTGVSAHVLSYIYLWFLPLVPIALTAWLVFPRNLSYGYWFATSQCIAWTLGTLSYYLLPTLGPGFEYASKYEDIAGTPSGDLMASLSNTRGVVLNQYDLDLAEGLVNSVAGFASLHTAITLLVALMVQFTLQSRILRIIFWLNFAITVVATIYFGWHYILDDVAGVFIAFVAFYVGGIASGQKFERGSLRSHPTTTSDRVPVDR